jgi:hypothetical protein
MEGLEHNAQQTIASTGLVSHFAFSIFHFSLP